MLLVIIPIIGGYDNIPEQSILMQGNTLVAVSSHYIPEVSVYGVKTSPEVIIYKTALSEEVLHPIKNEELINCLAECESDFNADAYNKRDPNGGSFGYMQFQLKTWNHYSEEVGIENPDIYDAEQQVIVADHMLSKGLGYHWGCWKKGRINKAGETVGYCRRLVK